MKCFVILSLLLATVHTVFAATSLPSPYERFTEDKSAALAAAAIKGDTKEIDKLVKDGADPNAISKDGVPVLAWALLAKSQDGFKALLDHHANPEAAINHHGLSPSVLALTVLIHRDESFWLEQLIVHGASPNFAVDVPTQRTLIYDTILYDREDLTVFLIKHGADINHLTLAGETPLIATVSGAVRLKATLALLQAGADWRLLNKAGKGLVDYLLIIAEKTKKVQSGPWWQDYLNVVRWLSSHQAKIPDALKAFVPEPAVPKKGS